jgi:hypothetical protein
MFMQALEEAAPHSDVFPYGIAVPFKVRDAVAGNKCASARVFLAEAPITALKDMCFYLQLDENGSIDDLVSKIVDYFVQLYPDRGKAVKSSGRVMQEKLASGPTPVRVRKQSLGTDATKALSADSAPADLKARLTELGKPTYGNREALWKRLQEAEAECATEEKAAAKDAKKKRVADEEEAASKALKRAKTTEKLQDQYCVAGLSIAAQMKLAMKMSMEG